MYVFIEKILSKCHQAIKMKMLKDYNQSGENMVDF